jgi:Fur family transcriptional regulator, ferric uptake regulator
MNVDDALSLLKSRKKRLTRMRKHTLDIIYTGGPVSAPDILKTLKMKKHPVNKSTLYREIKFLLKLGLINEVQLDTYVTHYESAFLTHHHHLVCKNCGNIKELICDELEGPLEKLEKRVRTKGFLINDHNLEFFGLCSSCN